MPYLVYVGLGSVFDGRTNPLALYGARALLVGAALLWGARTWLPLRGPRGILGSVSVGVVAGLAGTALWIALATPFAPANAPPWDDTAWLARAVVAFGNFAIAWIAALRSVPCWIKSASTAKFSASAPFITGNAAMVNSCPACGDSRVSRANERCGSNFLTRRWRASGKWFTPS